MVKQSECQSVQCANDKARTLIEYFALKKKCDRYEAALVRITELDGEFGTNQLSTDCSEADGFRQAMMDAKAALNVSSTQDVTKEVRDHMVTNAKLNTPTQEEK